MFSIKINFVKRSTKLIKKFQLLGMDIVYRSQPYVEVVGNNQNTLSLDVVKQAQPFLASYDNKT